MHLLVPIGAAEDTVSHSPQRPQVCRSWEAGDQGYMGPGQTLSHCWQRGPRSPSRRVTFLSVYCFSIDPQNFVDGFTSSPGYSVMNENPGLFKFLGNFRGLLNMISNSVAKFTFATSHSPPRRHVVV